MRPHVVFAFAALLLTRTLCAAEDGVVGTWRGPENSVIRIAPCGSTLCAKVLSTGDETAARIDTNNPDVALRTRPLCGLQIGDGFHGADSTRADGGHLYDPRSGKTYKGTMTSQGDVLLLRGYVGVSMFGRTARWQRVTAPVEMCSITPAAATPPAAIAAPAQAESSGAGTALHTPPAAAREATPATGTTGAGSAPEAQKPN